MNKSIKLVIFSQMISLLGSGLTRFGIAIWCFEKELGATAFSLIGVSAFLPGLLAAPFAGVLVDRNSKKKILVLSEIASATGSLILLGLALSDSSSFVALALATALGSIADSFQWPALSTSVSLLIPKNKLGKVNGVIESTRSLSYMLAPVAAGALIGLIQFEGLILLDFLSFSTALLILSRIDIPDQKIVAAVTNNKRNFKKDILEGSKFILSSKKLKTLLMVFMTLNLIFAAASTLRKPYFLSFLPTGQFSITEALIGLATILGGLLMARWGGPKKKIRGVVFGGMVEGVLLIPVALLPNFWTFCAYAIFSGLASPIINGSSQAIWQSETPLEIQGRVFSLRRTIAWILVPLSTGVIGPLSDHGIKPWIEDNQALAEWLTMNWPVDAGIEMSLLLFTLGALKVAAMGYFALRTCDVPASFLRHTGFQKRSRNIYTDFISSEYGWKSS